MHTNFFIKVWSLMLAIAIWCTMLPVGAIRATAATATEFAGGSGTEADPYLIETKAHLNNVRNHLGSHYKMIADIVFLESDFTTGGAFYNNSSGWKPIGAQSRTAFTGVFDGNNHTISNLQITVSTTDSWASYTELYTGLFGYVTGTIKSLNLTEITNSTYDHYHKIYVGGVAGYSTGTIENVTVNGTIEARSTTYIYVGGITGISKGSILKSQVKGNISGIGMVSEVCAAGIAGNASSVAECNNAATVSASSSNTMYAAGISAYNGSITNCYNEGNINGKCVGGIGGAYCTISQCYNTGKITGTEYAGGILGKGTDISDCYNIGDISATTYAGGIVGLMGSGEVKNCYNLANISNATYLGSIAGGNHGTVYSENHMLAGGTISNCYYPSTHTRGVGRGTGNGTAKAISDLKKQSTFANFDFSKTWTFTGNKNYFFPELRTPYLSIVVSSFQITSFPRKKTYLEGKDQLDLTGAKGLVTYECGFSDSVDLTLDMVSGFDNTIVGAQDITVTFDGKVSAFSVEITPKKLTSITLNSLPILTTYTEGIGKLDLSGATLLLSYNNGTSDVVDVTAGMVSGFDNSILGEQVITITHGGFSTTFGITILEKKVEEITISSLPTQLTYICMSEKVDVSGGVLTVKYNNGTYGQIPITNAMLLSYDNTQLGPQNITISYDGVTTSFEVVFIENTRDYYGGIGTESNPYLIATKEHLNNVRDYLGSHFKLICDIGFDDNDFKSGGAYYNSGKGWHPIGDHINTPFTGVFDGNNHSITNLQIYDALYNDRDVGLFGFNSGTIKNLTIANSHISTKSYPSDVGCIVGQNRVNGIIENCSTQKNIITSTAADNLGGIVGYNEGIIRFCVNKANITCNTSARVGGICGTSSGSLKIPLIQNCTNEGIVSLNAPSLAGSRVGGVVGQLGSNGVIEYSCNLGDIVIDAESALVGGITGEQYGTIQQSYNVGNLTVITYDTLYAGGITGLSSSGKTTNAFNNGSISGTRNGYTGSVYVGGIIGKQSSTMITSNCYSTGSLSGEGSASKTHVGYICGYNATSTIENCYYLGIADNGSGYGDYSTMYGKSASALQNKSTYQDFDFETVWTMSGDKYYPYPELIKTPNRVMVDIAIDQIVLRPTVAGIYFKGTFKIDSSVKASRHGIAVSVYNNLPVADDSDDTSLWTVGTNSVLVSNILDGSADDAQNGRMVIYARAYVLLSDGTYIYSDVVEVTLQQLVMAIDAKWDNLTTVQKDAISTMYNTFQQTMSTWDIPRIKEELA